LGIIRHGGQELKDSVGIDGILVGNLRKTQSELTVEAGGKNIVDVVGLHVEKKVGSSERLRVKTERPLGSFLF
jgi:hypothetical protein